MIWFAHASMQWLLQLGASFAALLLGAMPWTGGPLLIGFLSLLRAANKLLAAETHARPRRALGACLLGQAPGVALAIYVAACLAGLRGEAFTSMALLQFWTAVWSPLLALVPPVSIAGRGAYVWVTPVLSIAQLGWAAAPLLRQLRQPQTRTRAAAALTGSRSWMPPG